jgi:hypothetical protein
MQTDGVTLAAAILENERNAWTPHERMWIENWAGEMRETFERNGFDPRAEAARLVADVDKILGITGDDDPDWRRIRYAAAIVAVTPFPYATAA